MDIIGQPLAPNALYLRSDGSILVAQGDLGIELHPTPSQLLAHAAAAMRLALTLDPSLASEFFDVLANTHIVTHEEESWAGGLRGAADPILEGRARSPGC